MATGFAEEELEDAEELVREGKFEQAKQLVKNAQKDIEDYFDADTVGESVSEDKFERGVEQFQNEDSEEALLSTLDRLQDFVDTMKGE